MDRVQTPHIVVHLKIYFPRLRILTYSGFNNLVVTAIIGRRRIMLAGVFLGSWREEWAPYLLRWNYQPTDWQTFHREYPLYSRATKYSDASTNIRLYGYRWYRYPSFLSSLSFRHKLNTVQFTLSIACGSKIIRNDPGFLNVNRYHWAIFWGDQNISAFTTYIGSKFKSVC